MDMMELRRQIALNEPHIVTTAPAGIATFSTDMIAPLKGCKIAFSPVQSGSGDPSPSNVRPISGWAGCNVVRTGKNIVDLGTQSFTKYKRIDLSYPIKAGTYKLSATVTSTDTDASTCLIGFWDKAGGSQIASYTLSRNTKSGASITLSKDCKRIYLYAGNNYVSSDGDTATWQDIQIEVGSTATTYEPYSGSTIPIDWTTEAGTVYGGYVDPVKGELVATKKLITLTGANSEVWSNYTAAYYGFRLNLSDANINGKPIEQLLSDKFRGAGWRGALSGYAANILCTYSDPSAGTYVFFTTSITDKTEWLEWLEDNPTQLCYPIATPITYQLTPTQLKSLRGVNNIWSDANGDTTVKYWTH